MLSLLFSILCGLKSLYMLEILRLGFLISMHEWTDSFIGGTCERKTIVELLGNQLILIFEEVAIIKKLPCSFHARTIFKNFIARLGCHIRYNYNFRKTFNTFYNTLKVLLRTAQHMNINVCNMWNLLCSENNKISFAYGGKFSIFSYLCFLRVKVGVGGLEEFVILKFIYE